ncbi:MAG: mechanosensitive ion channel family protein [Methylococcaceae bacterium]
MNTPLPEHPEQPVLRKLLVPFVLSVLLGGFIFYGSEAYQIMGLAALENTIVIFGYALGIAEFLVLAVLVQRIVQLVFLDRLIAKALGAPTPRLLSQMSSAIIYTLAIAAIVGVVFKKDLTVVLATFGGASIVIGLALQRMIQDLFAGLTINLDRSINIGDFISLNKTDKVEGEVKEISWRTTQILDTNGNIIIVPNNLLSSTVITNFSAPVPFFESGIVVTLDIEIPVEKALRILRTAAIQASPQFSPLDAPLPKVVVRAITLQGVEYSITVFPTFKTRTLSRDSVQQQILRHLNFAGLAPAREKQEQCDFQSNTSTDATTEHCAKLLGATKLFQDLAEPELQLLAGEILVRQLPADTVLVQGGEIADVMILVIEGLLVAEEWRKKVGKKFPVADVVLGPGCLVNSTSMLAGGSCDATIRTKSEVLLCEINYAVIEKLLRQKPESGHYLSRRVAEQLNRDMADGGRSYYQQNSPSDVEELTAMVFKNLRRSFAHLKLD